MNLCEDVNLAANLNFDAMSEDTAT